MKKDVPFIHRDIHLNIVYSLITILFVILYLFSGAQNLPPEIEWQKSLGGSGYDEPQDVRQTLDGGYIIAGYSHSNDGDVTGHHEENDYWIVKLDSSGNIEWQKSLGGKKDDFASAIEQTEDGGYIVAGHSKSHNGDVSGNHGGADYWIVKLDSSGVIEWQNCFGGSKDEFCQSVQQTADGGYIVGGYTESNNGDVLGNHGGADYWIIKLDASGAIEWQKCFGGSDSDYGYSIQQTIEGGFIAGGVSYSNDGDVSGNHGERDYWIVKLDNIANIQWQKCFGGIDGDNLGSIQQASDGGFIVAGESGSNDGDVSGNHGNLDSWILKIDTSGSIEWQKCLGGTNNELANSIQEATDGGVIVAGISASNDGDVSGIHIDSGGNIFNDYWIFKLDSLGNLQWQKCLGGSNADYAYSIQLTADSGYIVAGSSYCNDGDVSGNHGSRDYWVVKLDCQKQIFYIDNDSDGFGNSLNIKTSCETPTGYVSDSTDCNDNNSAVNPSALEIPNNNFDDDCDGNVDEFGMGISSMRNKEAVFSVFPNPNNGNFKLSFQSRDPNGTKIFVEVMNILGQPMLAQEVLLINGEILEEIRLESSKEGVYIIRLTVGEKTFFSFFNCLK